MEDLVTIENVDDILEVMANTPVVDDTCFFFKEDKTSFPETVKFIDKSSKSDSEVALMKFLVKKGYKKYNAGLAIKMWLNWDDAKLSIDYTGVDKIKAELSEKSDTLKKILGTTARSVIETKRFYRDPLLEDKKLYEGVLLAKRNEYEVAIEERKAKKFRIFSRGRPSKKEKELMSQINQLEKVISDIDDFLLVTDMREAIEKAYAVAYNKLTKKVKSDIYKGLGYEKCAYEYITNHIVKPGNVSPNFVPLIASKSCSLEQMLPLLKPVERPGSKSISNEKYYMFDALSRVVPKLNLNFIITGTSVDSTKFKPLYDMILFFESNLEEFKPVLFQVIYSLAIMDFFGIVHNDLHLNNIMIQELPRSVCMRFVVPSSGESVDIDTKYIIKFFDWDRAYIKELGENTSLYGFSTSLHQVNNSRTKQDFAQFLCTVTECPKIWSYITSNLFPTIPVDRSFYFFDHKSTKDYTATVTNTADISRIVAYFKSADHKKYSSGDIDWVETDIDLIKGIGELSRKFEYLYPDKPIDNFSRVYIGVGKSAQVQSRLIIHFSHGWYCQSLFDISDTILKPASSYISDPTFLKKFKIAKSVLSCTPERVYTFPSTKPTHTSACTYTL